MKGENNLFGLQANLKMELKQNSNMNSELIEGNIKGLESKTNFVCINSCNTYGTQVKKYLGK